MARRAGLYLIVTLVVVVGGQASANAAGRPTLRYWDGPVVVTSTTHALFWEPPALQDGEISQAGPRYDPLLTRFLRDVGDTGYYRIAGQYYERRAHRRVAVGESSRFLGAYADKTSFPTAPPACRGEVDCVSTDQVQAEISRVMALQHWTAGPSDIVFVYLPPGEADCDPGTGTGRCSDASTDAWCSSHYASGTGASTILYAIVSYTSDGCLNVNPDGSQAPSPNRSVAADAAVSSTAHELMETVTDPLTDASGAGAGWTTNSGDEIADLCDSASFTPYGYDHGRANVEMHGHFYMVQPIWSNRAHRCTLGG